MQNHSTNVSNNVNLLLSSGKDAKTGAGPYEPKGPGSVGASTGNNTAAGSLSHTPKAINKGKKFFAQTLNLSNTLS